MLQVPGVSNTASKVNCYRGCCDWGFEQKTPSLSWCKGGLQQLCSLEKWVNTVGKASPLKMLPHPPPRPKAGEVGGAASGTGLVTTPPPARSEPQLPEDRPEHMALT